MTRALWRGTVIAASDQTQVVDGYTYFPADSIEPGRLRPSSHTSVCGWKGTARYYDVVVGDDGSPNAAWCYDAPLEAARHIAGWIGFWKDVVIEPRPPR